MLRSVRRALATWKALLGQRLRRQSEHLLRRLTLLAGVLTPLLLASASAAWAAEPSPPQLTVFAAASLTDALQQIGAEYTKATNTPVRFSFAASSALARQIEAGARVDVFFPADREWMDYLDARGLIDRARRRDLLGNRLALIAPAGSRVELRLGPGAPIAAALGQRGRLATGDPDSVPAGKYARSALSALGIWGEVESRLVRAENVRAALMYVARGEAPLGIVYATDARVEPRVRVVDLFPSSSHAPITYPVAATKVASSGASDFIRFLQGPRARAIFEAQGFELR